MREINIFSTFILNYVDPEDHKFTNSLTFILLEIYPKERERFDKTKTVK
jgi:hypothetical protein